MRPIRLFLAVGRFVGDALDGRTVDAEVGEFPRGQLAEFGKRGAVNRALCQFFSQVSTEGCNALGDRLAVRAEVGSVSHGVSLSALKHLRCVMLALLPPIFGLLLQMHNTGFWQCCYAANA